MTGTMLGRYLRFMFRATDELNRQALLALATPKSGGRFLDCGCGDGSFTSRLGSRIEAAETHGIEKVDFRVAEARQRGIVVAPVDLEEPLPYDDASFDVVHANQLIEHMIDPDRFLREVRRVLRPDGYVLLSTNNLASWHNVMSLALGFQPTPVHVSTEVVLGNPLDPFRGTAFAAREDSHQRVFSYAGLRDLVLHHGFRILAYRSVGCYPLPAVLARIQTRIDPRHGVYLVTKLARA